MKNSTILIIIIASIVTLCLLSAVGAEPLKNVAAAASIYDPIQPTPLPIVPPIVPPKPSPFVKFDIGPDGELLMWDEKGIAANIDLLDIRTTTSELFSPTLRK